MPWVGSIDHPRLVKTVLRRLISGVIKPSDPVRFTLNSLNVQADDTALELGCGPNKAMPLLLARARHATVYGVDPCPERIEETFRVNRSAAKGRLMLYRTNFDHLPFETESIDKIISVEGVYSWENPIAVAQEMRRVLRPGGRMAIFVSDAQQPLRSHLIFSRASRLLPALELKQFMELGGFDSDDITVRAVEAGNGCKGLLVTAVS